MSDSVPLYGFGGGGAALNFAVKQYASEAQLLAAKPKENTIGFASGTKMTGWYFSPTQPEVLQEGYVWFPVGTSSHVGFNALKKNGIQIYPLIAKQYINGAWVEVAARSYVNGAWVNWYRYLFLSGDQYEGITGGWTMSGYTISSDFNSTNNSQVAIGSAIVCRAHCPGESSDRGGACGTVVAIDTTHHTTMRVKGYVTGYNSRSRLYVGVNTSKKITKSPTAVISLTADGYFEKTLPLPTTERNLYFFVLAACYTSTTTGYTSVLTVNDISLE